MLTRNPIMTASPSSSAQATAPETSGPGHEPKRVKGFLGLLYIAVCTLAVLYAPQPLLNVLRQDFGISEADAGLAISVTLLPLGIAPLAYGALLGRLSSRTLLTGAVLLLGLSGVLLYVAPNYPLFLAGRFVQGLIIPAIFTAVMAAISTKFQGAYLQRAMALYIGATIFGGMAGRLLSGFISSLYGWRVALLLISLSMLPALWFLIHVRPETRPKGGWPRFSDFAAVLREPGVRDIMLIEACTFFVFVGIANLVPFRMEAIGGGASEFRVGLMYSSYTVGIALALWSRRVIGLYGGEMRALMAGLGIYILSFAGFATTNVSVLFVMMFLMSLGQFTEHTIAPGLVNRLSSKDKGMVNGLYLAFYYGGGVLGSYLPGLVHDAYGWNVCLAGFMVLLLVAAALAWRVRTLTTS